MSECPVVVSKNTCSKKAYRHVSAIEHCIASASVGRLTVTSAIRTQLMAHEQITTDITDLEALLAKAERPKVQALLTDYLNQLRAEQLTLKDAGLRLFSPVSPAVTSSPSKASAPAPAASARAPAPAPAPVDGMPPHLAELMKAATEELEKAAGDPPPEVTKLPFAAKPAKPAARPVVTPAPAPAPPPPARIPTKAPVGGPSVEFTSMTSFAWDQDTYGTEPNYVYVYITSGVDGVGEIKDRVDIKFTPDSFDLKVVGLNGKNLRLLKTNLDKKIVPGESKIIVKKNQIKIKMKKTKGDCTSPAPAPPAPHVLHTALAARATNDAPACARRWVRYVDGSDGEAAEDGRRREGEGPGSLAHGHDEGHVRFGRRRDEKDAR